MTDKRSAALAEWQAHWPKVLAAMLGMSFFSMISYSFGLFIEPLEQDFGWKRAAMSLGLTVFTATAMIFGPFAGALLDRFGARRIGIGGITLTAIAFSCLGLANGSLTQWYGLWLIIALAAVAIKTTVWSSAISSLFTTSRGLALAVVLCGSAIGQSLSPLLGNWLIAGHGWRDAYRLLALGWGGFALIMVALFFFDARDGARRAAAGGTATSPTASPSQAITLGGLTPRQALRDSRILRIALANIIISTLGSGVSLHMVPILSQTGLDRASAAGIAATAGLAGIAGKIITGWLLDRVQGNVVPVSSFALAAVGHALLLNTLGSIPALTFGVMVLGYTSGAGLQVTTYLITRYGGMRHYGKIYGTIGSMLMLGTSLGPWIAGLIHDMTGSYQLLIMLAIPSMVMASTLFMGLGAYPDFSDKPQKGGDAA